MSISFIVSAKINNRKLQLISEKPQIHCRWVGIFLTRLQLFSKEILTLKSSTWDEMLKGTFYRSIRRNLNHYHDHDKGGGFAWSFINLSLICICFYTKYCEGFWKHRLNRKSLSFLEKSPKFRSNAA